MAEKDKKEPERTDWSRLSFEQMYDGVHKEDGPRQRQAAAGWVKYAQKLEALSLNLAHYRESLKPHWNSGAGDFFLGKITEVVGSIDSAALNARGYAEILRATAEAAEEAQRKMNDLSKERTGYLREKDDYNNLGDDNDLWHDTLDVFDDVGHNIGGFFTGGGNNIDPKKLEEFKNRAITILEEMAGKYLNTESHRVDMPAFKGPQSIQMVKPVIAVPQAPGMPGAPNVPLAGPPPVPLPPPVPVLPPPPVVPPPVVPVVNVPAPPAPPGLPGLPPAPSPPGLPVLPIVPGLGVGKGPGPSLGLTGKPSLSMPPSPSLGGGRAGQPGQTGMPPTSNTRRSGVIGERPGAGKTGLPPSAGGGKSGKTGLPPSAGGGKGGRTGIPPSAKRGGKGAVPPSANDERGVIGRRPGAGKTALPPGAGEPSHGGGMPPPSGRRGKGADPRDPMRAKGTPEAAGPRSAARGTPPPTISNRSAGPPRPVDLDHDSIGGRPGTRGGAQPPAPRRGAGAPGHGEGDTIGRRPGIAARNAAAPPVVRNSDPKHQQQEESWRRTRRPVTDVEEGEFAVTEQTVAAVIETPDRIEHGREERGPAIGQLG